MPFSSSQFVAATLDIRAQIFNCAPPYMPPSLQKICLISQNCFIFLVYAAGRCSHLTQGGLPTIKSCFFRRAINMKLVVIRIQMPSHLFLCNLTRSSDSFFIKDISSADAFSFSEKSSIILLKRISALSALTRACKLLIILPKSGLLTKVLGKTTFNEPYMLLFTE